MPFNAYDSALAVQGACNLGAVVRSFGRDIIEVQKEGHSTDGVAKHPVVRLYLEQLAFLAGLTLSETENATTYTAAYDICERKARRESVTS